MAQIAKISLLALTVASLDNHLVLSLNFFLSAECGRIWINLCGQLWPNCCIC